MSDEELAIYLGVTPEVVSLLTPAERQKYEEHALELFALSLDDPALGQEQVE
jgi:hypothetical protein